MSFYLCVIIAVGYIPTGVLRSKYKKNYNFENY